MQTRLVTFITVLAVEIGLIFGLVLGMNWKHRIYPPVFAGVSLDAGGQNDYIIAVAEAYSSDSNVELARDRLARLHSPDIVARVENLASDYVPQFDLVSQRLAALAVALGSTNPTLIVLSVPEAPSSIQVSYAPPAGPAEENVETASGNPPPSAGEPLLAAAPEAKSASFPTNDRPVPPPKGGAKPNAPSAPAQSAPSDPAKVPTKAPVAQVVATPRPPGAGAASAQGTQETIPPPKANPPASRQPLQPKRGIVASIPVKLPDYVGAPSSSIPLTARPSKCTPASEMPAVVDHPIMLCPKQGYGPFQVRGENITIFGDKTAIVHGKPRGFGITVAGSNITLSNVNVVGETDPADLNTWLCLYDSCSFKNWTGRGGAAYGGGILLDHTTNAAVVSSTASGGTIGVAAVGGSNNKLVDNHLSNHNGWGILLVSTNQNYVVGNTLNQVNRACTAPDGNYLQSGCESSALVAIHAQANMVVSNHCEHAANCYYAPGDGGYASNNNKFFNNYCAAAGNNCFEVTFSQENKFDYNVGGSDPNHAEDKCDYPFWISGSTVKFGTHNQWNCKHSSEQALNDSRKGTKETTGIEW